MSGYIWYSTGSDVTGPKMAEALGFQHGKKTPKFDSLGVVVGWGCKAETRQQYDPKKLKAIVQKGQLRTLNHPDAITAARNKLRLLEILREGGAAVPGFLSVKDMSPGAAVVALRQAVDDGVLQLPCVGFNEFNKGKPVFCWTKEDLEQVESINRSRKKDAVKLHYFRTLFHGTEYRIHVFRDEALCAETKILAKDPVEATAKSLFGRLKKRVGEDVKATEQEMRFAVEELATDLLRGPSHLQRSVQFGWELTPTDVAQIPAAVVATAINALDIAGLDMGAVSVVLEDEQAIVTNIISAPGLSDEQMALYVEAIKEFAGAQAGAAEKKEKKAKPAAGTGEVASQEIIARITRKVRTGKISQKKAEELLAALE